MNTWRVDSQGRLSRGTPAKDRRATAHHEAAHAVVAHYLGGKVMDVQLQSHFRGVCYIHWQEIKGRCADHFSQAVVSLAGHEAEVRFYGRPIQHLPLLDYNKLRHLGVSKKSLNLVSWVARRCVAWHAKDIRRVAKALLRNGRLTRRGFLQALRSK